MRGSEKLRRALLRWDHLLMVFVLGLPFAGLMFLGVLWLFEHDGILWFLGASLVVGACVFLLRRFVRRQWEVSSTAAADALAVSVEPDPEWLPKEKAVFAEVSKHISELTSPPLAWDDLPEQALDVVNRVAAGLGGKNKSALKFTLPEALLLLETTASRYREHLRTKLPFSDQISLATMYWLWRHRGRANLLWKFAHGSGRVARFAFNPTAGVLRELEQLVAGGNSNYVTGNMLGVMQAVLLEEVAYGAIDLYSGRLRFSETELLQIQLASDTADKQRMALPDLPLRILFVGQTSAGKSTLINALLARERAETDAARTTENLVTYQTELDGIACHFLDSEGLDGSSASQQAMLGEMVHADIVVWVLRANRPGRETDLRLKRKFDSWFESHPRRRKPVVIAVATAMDQILANVPGMTQPPSDAEELPAAAQKTTDAAVKAIGSDMEGLQPLPVSVGPQPWRVDTVIAALRGALAEAHRVQRNRRRVEGARGEGRLRSQVKKGGRGVRQGARLVGGRVARTFGRKQKKSE